MSDAVGVAGGALIVAGFTLLATWVGLVVAGVLLIGVAWRLS